MVWSIKRLCKCIDGMMDNQFDCIVFIEGKRGLGKSTIGQQISYKSKAKFKPRKDIAFSRDDVIRQLGQKRKGVILADELINVGYNRDFWDQDQKTLIKALNMYRDKCNLFIGCIPYFTDLDKQMQKLCKIRITVLRRGYALLQLQTKSIYSNDPWDVDNNKKVERKFKAGKIKYSKLSTVKGIIKFNDITPKQREIYEEVKAEKRGQVFEAYNGENQEEDPVIKIFNKMQKEKMSIETLNTTCQLLGLKIKSVRNRLNEMIKQEGLDGTLQDYIVPQATLVKEQIKAKSNKKSRKFELIAEHSRVMRDLPPPEPNKPVHNSKKYKEQHIWGR